MHLTCPSCSTPYTVDDSVIPPEGRQMRCWRCRYTWLQKRTPDATAPAPAAAAAVLPERPEYRLSDDVARILREEAELEQRVRQAERGDGGAPEAGAAAMPELRDEAPLIWPMPRRDPPGAASVGVPAAAPAAVPASPQLLPAGAEAGANRAGTDADQPDARAAGPEVPAPPVRRRHPGRWGAGLVMAAALVALSAYLLAPRLSAAVPEWAPVLDAYAARVEALRAVLARAADGVGGTGP